MQAYSPAFALVYDKLWGGFANDLAPRLLDFHTRAAPGGEHSLLDLCCGAGHLALFFLEHGYRVTGVDLSAGMLEYARRRCQAYAANEQADFIQADAAHFQLPRPVGLAISTYDALNHLQSLDDLRSCFGCVRAALLPGGLFIFDLNTRAALRRYWNGIHVDDTPELLLVNRAIYDGEGPKAFTRISGFMRLEDGRYERFEEVVYNTVFEMSAVREALLEAGFDTVHAARGMDLSAPIDDLESDRRIFFVARK